MKTHKITFVLPPLFGHARPMIELAKQLSTNGHEITIIIPSNVANWICGTNEIKIKKWDISYNIIDLIKEISAYKTIVMAEAKMLKILASLYSLIFTTIAPLLNNKDIELLVIDRSLIPVMDVAYQKNIPYILISQFVGSFAKVHPRFPRFGTKYTSEMKFYQQIYNYFAPSIQLLFYFPTIIKLMYIRKEHKVTIPLYYHFSNIDILIGNAKELETTCNLSSNHFMVGPMINVNNDLHDEEIDSWMKGGNKEGFIYISFGTLVHLTEPQIVNIVEALSGISAMVLWSLPGELHKYLPGNLPNKIMMKSYLPQRQILANENVKLFISHAGINSIHEAILNGVPLLTIPFICDEYFNSARILDLGVGLRLFKKEILPSNIGNKIIELLDNPIYKERAVKLQKRLKELNGLDRAVKHIEYMLT